MSLEYITSVATNSYTSDGIKIRMDTLCQKSDELGGMAVNFLIFNTKERIQVSNDLTK